MIRTAAAALAAAVTTSGPNGGGIRTRLMQLRAGEGSPAWRDALAVFSVVAPIALLGMLTAGYLANLAGRVERPGLSRLTLHNHELVSERPAVVLTALIAAAVAVAALAICPAMARRSRVAAAAVVGLFAAAATLIGLVRVYQVFGAYEQVTLYISLIVGMDVLALVASPGPARGWQLLSRRGLIVLIGISVVEIAASTASGNRYEYWNYLNSLLDLSGFAGMLGVALTLRRSVGSRLVAFWAIPGYQFIGYPAAQYLLPRLQGPPYFAFRVEFLFLPTAAVAALVGLAAWSSGRQDRFRRADASG